MLFVESTYPYRIAGDLIYCVAYIKDNLDLSVYSDLNNIYETWIGNNWLTNRHSSRKADFFSSIFAEDMNLIMKCIDYRFVEVPVNILNNHNTSEIHTYIIEELDSTIDLFRVSNDLQVYTTDTNILSYKHKINLLNKVECQARLSFCCFITKLISNSKFNSLLKRYSIIYPQYTWLDHRCCLSVESVREALKKPTIYHKKDFVLKLPKYLFRYFLDDDSLKQYLDYLDNDPSWWNSWSDINFREYLTDLEYKTLLVYNYYSERSSKKLVKDNAKYKNKK